MPHPIPATNYFAIWWELVDSTDNPNVIPSVSEIKKSLCMYGPISVSMIINEYFPYFQDGVINDTWPDNIANHAVEILGSNESKQAWLCKNTYGKDGWGSNCGYGNAKGYFWINYNSLNIGKKAGRVWPVIQTP